MEPAEPDPGSCWYCGYSRAGLQDEDVCPECGRAHREVWREARAHWLSTLSFLLAMLAMLTACLGPVGLVAALLAVGGGAWVLTHRNVWRSGRDESLALASLVFGSMGIVFSGLWTVVVFFL